MAKQMTASAVAAAIRANVDALYDSGRSYEDFTVEQHRLWGYAHGRSQRFSDMVAEMVMPPMAHRDLGQ